MLTEKGKRSFQELNKKVIRRDSANRPLAEELPGLALTHYENIKADNSFPFLSYKYVGLSFRPL